MLTNRLRGRFSFVLPGHKHCDELLLLEVVLNLLVETALQLIVSLWRKRLRIREVLNLRKEFLFASDIAYEPVASFVLVVFQLTKIL